MGRFYMTSNTSRTRGRDRVLEDVVRSSAVDRQQRQTRRRLVGTPLGAIAILAIVVFAFFRQVNAISVPEDFANDEDGTLRARPLQGRDRRALLPVLAVDDVREPLFAPHLRELLLELVAGARVLRGNRRGT